jgi:hypothetical protein
LEIKCQLDAADEFLLQIVLLAQRFGHHYAHHQELESIIQVVAACRIWCFFSSCRYGVELRVVCPVCGLLHLLHLVGILFPHCEKNLLETK